MPKPGQETIAILGAGVALAALTWSTNSTLRAEVQAGRLRLETRLLAVDKEQARTTGLLVWNETVPRPPTALPGGRPRQRSPLEGLGITGRAGSGAAFGTGGRSSCACLPRPSPDARGS